MTNRMTTTANRMQHRAAGAVVRQERVNPIATAKGKRPEANGGPLV